MSKMLVEYVAHSGSDLLVVNAARASFGKESSWEYAPHAEIADCEVAVLSPKDTRLINYLAREKHLLPFRHPTLTLRCKAPIFVARQLMKHQSGMSWSEESRRYIDSEPEFFWPDKWRKRAENIKQGSSDEEVTGTPVINLHEYGWSDCEEGDVNVKDVAELCLAMYSHLLKCDVSPEQARMILPQNMMVTWVWTGTLLAWQHMLHQRLDSHAQKETRDFAQLVETHVINHYPQSYAALKEHS